MKTTLTILFFSFIVIQAQARLGETEAQIVARYGDALMMPYPVKQEESRQYCKLYKHDGLCMLVSFLDGKSQFESYHKADQTPLAKGEVEIFLQNNTLGSKWVIKVDNASWELESKAATAFYVAGNEQTLSISTAAYNVYSTEKRVPKNKLKDF